MPPPVTGLSRRALLAAACATGLALVHGCARQSLGEAERRTLTRVARDLFPHPILSDAPYRAIVEAAFPPGGDAAKLAAAAEAVRRLDAGATPWESRPETERKAALAPMLADPFFLGFRFAVLTGLYSDLSVTRRFGYEGPSFEQGGYLARGFDALPWLPSPAAGEASRWPI
jgi:hypothetical protein